MPFFKSNLAALADAGLRDSVKVMVGGAPVTQEYADSVGADGFAPDASAAVRLAKQLMVDMGYDVSMGATTVRALPLWPAPSRPLRSSWSSPDSMKSNPT